MPPASRAEQKYPGLCPRAGDRRWSSPRSPNRQASGVEPSGSQVTRSQAIERRSGGDNVYVVAEGSTLFDIARYELGEPRWANYALNREVLGEDFDYLQPGVELAIGGSGEPMPIRLAAATDGRSGKGGQALRRFACRGSARANNSVALDNTVNFFR